MHVPITVLTSIVQKSNIYFEQKLCALHQPFLLCSQAYPGTNQITYKCNPGFYFPPQVLNNLAVTLWGMTFMKNPIISITVFLSCRYFQSCDLSKLYFCRRVIKAIMRKVYWDIVSKFIKLPSVSSQSELFFHSLLLGHAYVSLKTSKDYKLSIQTKILCLKLMSVRTKSSFMELKESLQMSEQSNPKATGLHTGISRILHLIHFMLFPVVNYWSQCHIHTTGAHSHYCLIQ